MRLCEIVIDLEGSTHGVPFHNANVLIGINQLHYVGFIHFSISKKGNGVGIR